MDNTIDTLSIEIEASGVSAEQSLNKLKNTLRKLSEMSKAVASVNTGTASNLKKIAEGIEMIGKAGSSAGLANVLGTLKAVSKVDFSNITRGSDKVSEVISKMAATANKSVNIAPIAGKTDIASLNGTANVTNKIKEIWSGIRGTSGEVTNEYGKQNEKLKEISGSVNNLKNIMSSLGRGVLTGLGKTFEFIGKTATKPFVNLKNSIQGVTKKVSGLFRSIGRIALYRAIRFTLSQITNSIKEGVNNAYQYSKAMGGSLASSMDRIATSALYLKNSLGAMVAPLINALAPAIEYVIDRVVALINVINQLFAKLTGSGTWLKAVKVQTEYAKSAGGAAKAAKSLTAAFDELNVLSDSGSGGGGGGTPDYGSMFKEMKLDGNFAPWLDQIKDAINKGDWKGVGQILGDKVNELVDKIDFEGMGKKLGKGIQSALEMVNSFIDTVNFDKIGSGIAKFFNGIFDTVDFTEVGKLLGTKIKIAIDVAYGFVRDFNWSKFGTAVGDGIMGFINRIDFSKAVDTIQKGLIGLLNSIQSVAETIEWGKIGKKISDALMTIDFKSIGTVLGKAVGSVVKGILDGLIVFVGETDWGKLIADLGEGIGNALANMDLSGILARLGALLAEVIGWIPIISLNLIAGISYIIAGIFEGLGLDGIAGFFKGIGDALRSVGTWLKENFVDPVVNWIKRLFGIHSPSTVFAEIGRFLIEGLLQGIKGAWNTITTFFTGAFEGLKNLCKNTWNAIKETATTIWNGISGFFKTSWEGIKTVANNIWGGIKTVMSDTWNSVKTTAITIWNGLGTTLKTTWEGLKSSAGRIWDGIKGTIGSAWKTVETTTKSIWNGLKGTLTGLWEGLKTNATRIFDNVKTFIGNTWNTLKTTTGNIWGGIRTSLSGVWSGIQSTASTAFSSMKNNICSVWNGLQSYISGATGTISGIVNNMKNAVSTGVQVAKGLLDGIVTAAGNAVNGIKNVFSGIGTGISNGVNWVGKQFGFASGGFPETGQLFMAREAGAEMVGSIGGRTAVANNDQIVAAISQGVFSAVRAAEGSNKSSFDIKVYLDGKQINSTIKKIEREQGATIYPGGVVNAI